MAAFEVFMVQRPGATDAYSAEVLQAAQLWFDTATGDDQAQLLAAIMSGLPGTDDRYDIKTLRTSLQAYDGLTYDDLRANLKPFLDEIIPTGADLGMAMCIHPDDPPRDILGLPRIMSNTDDIARILTAEDAPVNGLTLCTGSLGANPANDLPKIAKTFADRIHFAHLRNVTKDPDGSFQEAAHLEGDTDMVAVIKALLAAEKRRGTSLPFRPDHGHDLLSDVQRKTHPGYPMIGRLRGLAELRGVTMSYDSTRANSEGEVNTDVIKLSQRFAVLMGEYNQSIADGVITINEAKRLLRETTSLQQVLIEMKLHLEEGS